MSDGMDRSFLEGDGNPPIRPTRRGNIRLSRQISPTVPDEARLWREIQASSAHMHPKHQRVAAPDVNASAEVAEQSRERRPQPMEPRELRAQLLVAALFLRRRRAAARVRARGREVPVTDLVLLVLAAVDPRPARLRDRRRLHGPDPARSSCPMLFVLPPAIVPLAAAARAQPRPHPGRLAGRRHPQRLRDGARRRAGSRSAPRSCSCSPTSTRPQLGDWPLYLLALLAQFAGDFLSAAVRERLGHGLAAAAGAAATCARCGSSTRCSRRPGCSPPSRPSCSRRPTCSSCRPPGCSPRSRASAASA